MNLQQLHDLKLWHDAHGNDRPVEHALYNGVLGAWVCGWVMLPLLMAFDTWLLTPASLVLTLLPESYHHLRTLLHRRGLLRCDWLVAVRDY